jgi:hypothetical protein
MAQLTKDDKATALTQRRLAALSASVAALTAAVVSLTTALLATRR